MIHTNAVTTTKASEECENVCERDNTYTEPEFTNEEMHFIENATYEISTNLDNAFELIGDLYGNFFDRLTAPKELLAGGYSAQCMYEQISRQIHCIINFLWQSKVELEVISGTGSKQKDAYLNNARRILALDNESKRQTTVKRENYPTPQIQ